jgi:hypothetical protein
MPMMIQASGSLGAIWATLAAHAVVERVINLDHGIPINVTTQAGTAFDILAADCAACIERGGVEKQRVLIENKSPSQRRYS